MCGLQESDGTVFINPARHIRLSIRCKIWFTLGLFANYFSLKHECALKLTYLWNTSLLFDLNYKFINGCFAFSRG